MAEVVETKPQSEEGPKLVQMSQQEGEASKETQEKKVHKFDSKWEMIDKIKASDEPSVVVNIFRVHPEATWKEIKEVYKDISMKIEKVPNKEGIFNLLFRNHNDAIEFIRISPKTILDQKFTMRLNDRLKTENSSGWNEMGSDGHTQKFETKKYYQNKSKNYKKPHEKTDRHEDEEHKNNHDGAEGEVKENNEEGLDLPTRKFHKEEPTSDKVTRAPKGDHEHKGPRRFIGDVNKTGKTTSTATTGAVETQKETKAPADDWITKKDPVVEKREAEEAKKKAAAALQKEKEAKKEQAEKAKQAPKKPVADFSDGW